MTYNINLYIKRKRDEYHDYPCYDDVKALYSSYGNDDLCDLLGALHCKLNDYLRSINKSIQKTYDDEGNTVYSVCYYHAEDSRKLIAFLDSLQSLIQRLRTTQYALALTPEYEKAIRSCKGFLAQHRGSQIPEGLEPFVIEEAEPIFVMRESIGVSTNALSRVQLKIKGEGSYARVFRYEDPSYGIPIALKRALPSLDAKELERFKREFEVLKCLNSPYIVKVYNYNNEANEYTMEYIDKTIETYIQHNNDRLSLERRKGIIRQICRALEYIHNKGLLHRDLSITNVLVQEYEDTVVVKLSDFGLVKIENSTLTSTASEIKGSLNDPDLQRYGFANYNICHETYALTKLCFYILTGKSNIEHQASGMIKDFYFRGTDPVLENRYQSVEDLLQTVESIQ